jgi:hypothetical protein
MTGKPTSVAALRVVRSPLVSEPPVRIALPSPRYVGVARLVAAGVATRLELPYDEVDDLQLALEMALDAVFAEGTQATVTIDTEPALLVTVGPVAPEVLDRRLHDADSLERLNLRSVLDRLVDEVAMRTDPFPSIVLRVDHRQA